MRRKLFISTFSMIIIILMIVAGNQIIIRLFANFSSKLITEYHELHSLQELKVSLGKASTYLSLSFKPPIDYYEDFSPALQEAFTKLETCKEVISAVHMGENWQEILFLFENIQDFNAQMNSTTQNVGLEFSRQMFENINQVTMNINEMVNETLVEIEEYEHRNETVVKHGSLTILFSGILLITFLGIGGLRFIKNLTRPIDQLVDSMKQVSEGNTKMRVQVDSTDEFQFLANSFNSMLEVLNSTTVSKEFFSNILNNLYGSLIVTDSNGEIRFINETVRRQLAYSEEEIIGQVCLDFFNIKHNSGESKGVEKTLRLYSELLVNATEMKTRNGKLIPAYVTCTILKNHDEVPDGMVVVGHDLTHEKAHEEKLEKVRKARLIAINEAQENERIRFAKDLHDGLGQILTGISYSLNQIKPSNSNEEMALSELYNQVDTAIQEAKHIAHNLTPVILRDFGLVAALRNLVEKTNQLNITRIILNSYNVEDRIDSRLEKALYRICQECLNNIIKHAQATDASIELFKKPDQIVLVIEDNGIGFDPKHIHPESEGGIGLFSIRERTYVFDGHLTVNSQPGRGTEIIIEIPCFGNNIVYG